VTASTTRPTVLLIGPDRYTFRACQNLGINAVVMIGPVGRDSGLTLVPDEFTELFVDDQKNPESVLMALHRAGLGATQFDAVLTINEYAQVLVSLLARVFGCRAMAPETAVRFRDKWLQKRIVRAAGLRAARSILIEDIRYLGDPPDLPQGPAVLKPVAGAGTKLTTVVTDSAQLRAAADRLSRQQSALRTFVLEEFIDGDEWLVDGVVADGELAFYSVARYGEPCLATLRSGQPLTFRRFDPVADEAAYRSVHPIAERALAALGMLDGVFHMELFHDADRGELVFGECAARRGAALVQEEVHCKFNVDLSEEALRRALGWPPRLEVKIRPGIVGTTYLRGRPGTLMACPSPAQLMEREGVRYARIEMPVGSEISGELGNTGVRLGQVLLAATTADQLEDRIEKVRRWFDERLIVAPPGATLRMLREWQRGTWPTVDFADAPPYEPA
jgi:biotin carboxylase